MTAPVRDAGDPEPFCSACGYSLKGCTESSKCPECGRPIVEVLMRDSFQGRKGYRFQSTQRVWGLPLVSIATGPHGREKMGKPVGVIAIGDLPLGVIAIGGVARGGIAIGGASFGVIGFGGCSIGLVALGGCAIGLLAIGGTAIGGWSIGAMCIYVFRAWGASAWRLPLS
jgi:hypothetical protein